MIAVASFLLQLAFGWLLADFLSGVLHWIEDRFGPGREHWPFFGPEIFEPNLDHHRDPTRFLLDGFVERNWTTWVVVAPITLLLVLAFGFQPWIASAALAGAMANEIHAWAHDKRRAPRWIAPLQEIGMLQSPAQHAAHHVPAFSRNYCVITDWLNPLLERVRFWAQIEALLPQRWFR